MVWLRRFRVMGTLLAVAVGLGACAGGPGQPVPPTSAAIGKASVPDVAAAPAAGTPASFIASPAATPVVAAVVAGYVLGPGDKVRILVFNEIEMSREYEVDSAGKVTLALIGAIQAAGLTPSQLQEQITVALAKGYLRSPKVSIEVANYRPFYMIGEISKSGEYPYRHGLNVISAVALAGGYSYRANTRSVFVRRANDTVEREFDASSGVMVGPGDIIRIPERYF